MRDWKRILSVCTAAVFLLSGCGGITDEMFAEREAAIQMMESGDYESAVAAFNGLVEKADSVTNFEVDILKYRAEAEYQLGDYRAAAYTYDILNQIDKERAEYCYFAALSMAKYGDASSAEVLLEKGMTLKEQPEDGMVLDAVDYARAEISSHQVLKLMEQEAYEDALKEAENSLSLISGAAAQELRFYQAACYEYLGQWEKALVLFESYVAEYGSDEKAEHEIEFLKTR